MANILDGEMVAAGCVIAESWICVVWLATAEFL